MKLTTTGVFNLIAGLLILIIGGMYLSDCSGLKEAENEFKAAEIRIDSLRSANGTQYDSIAALNSSIDSLARADSLKSEEVKRLTQRLQQAVSQRANRPAVAYDRDQQDRYFKNEFGGTLQDTAVVNQVIDSLEDRKHLVVIEKLQGKKIKELETRINTKDLKIDKLNLVIARQDTVIQNLEYVDGERLKQIEAQDKLIKKYKRQRLFMVIGSVAGFVLSLI